MLITGVRMRLNRVYNLYHELEKREGKFFFKHLVPPAQRCGVIHTHKRDSTLCDFQTP